MQTPEIDRLSGQVIRSYEVSRIIGVGGFGIVYQAYQRVVERDVAIKVILPQYADHPDFIRHFESEAQIIAQLEHPYIVPLYDFWREPGGAYLVMRWLRGGSLRDHINEVEKLDLPTIARILDQITEALSVAHQKGIVHQDIKPENILLDELNNAYLTDFGIAKRPFGAESAPVEEVGFGTAAYASPEQIMRHPVTAQTDIYSLGMMLYELLTGRVPFASENDSKIIERQLHDIVPLVGRGDVPEEVNRVIWRATAKRPEERYPNALLLATEFNRAIQRSIANRQNIAVPPFARASSGAESPAETKALFELWSANPYKGLQAFLEADQADFFGREALIEKLLDRLRLSKGGSRFLAVVGPSGSGKSSVVQAGLIPRLRRGALEGSRRWFITQMTPGVAPFTELEAALIRISHTSIPDLETQIRQPEGGLLRTLKQMLPDEQTEFVLVIDQFEEIFTLCDSEVERALFLDGLFHAVNEAQSRLRVVVTLRADFYDRPLMYPAIGELVRNNTEVVLPLSVDGLMQAIAKPAERYGLELEPGLLSTIVEDVHRQPSSLPLLQHALTELHNRRQGRLLTRAAYNSSGGVLGALALRAEEIYETLDHSGKLAARQVFLHLVLTDRDAKRTSRRVLRAELMPEEGNRQVVSNVLDAFQKYSLLTFDHDPTTRSPTVQIAHDALIRVWERLKDWIDANQENLRMRQSLTSVSQEWLNSNQEPSFLASGSRLAQFEGLLENDTLILSEAEKQYLNASIALRQKAVNRLRLLIAIFAIFSVVSFSLALLALDRQAAAVAERDRADQEAQTSRSRELAVLALTNSEQTDLSLLLSLEALRSANTFEARNSLLTGLQSKPHLSSFLQGHSDAVRAVDFSPSGDLLATGGRDSAIVLWRLGTDRIQGSTLTGHTGWVNALDFSPDGRLLASASEDGSIRLWDVATGAVIGEPLLGHVRAVRGIAFSPDGQLLASAGDDGSIRLWDVETSAPVGEPLLGHTSAVWSVAFSPNGEHFASGSADQTIRLWEVASRTEVGEPLVGHSNWVLNIAFSPDGRLLASGGADNLIYLWDVEADEPLGQPLSGHSNWVRSVVFSPDGQQLVSGSIDQTVRLWNLQDLSQVTLQDVYQAHTDGVWGVAFSADGRLIASAGADRKVILWDTTSSTGFSRFLSGSSQPVLSIAVDSSPELLAAAGGNQVDAARISFWEPDGSTPRDALESPSQLVTSLAFNPVNHTLASGSFDGFVRLWEAGADSPAQELFVPGSRTVYAVAFSPDGSLLAVATDRAEIMLWDVESGTQAGWLAGHNDSVYTIAFSPDGSLLASGGREDAIQLWDLATRQPVGEPLTGHSDSVMSVAFSADGSLLASGSRDYTVRLWDVRSGQLYREPFTGHSDWVTSVVFSADDQLIASGSQDDTVRLWDLASGQAFGLPFNEHQNWVNAVRFAADSSLLVSGGQDGNIVLRDVSLPALQALACNIVNRNLTDEEWNSYFPDRSFHETCFEASLS